MAVPERLNQDQIALVLRRAAELDREVGTHGHERGLDAAAVEAAAVEAGLSQPAVRRALAEYEIGLLDGKPPERRHKGLLGPATLVVTRAVPGPADAVEAQLCQFLKNQLFELRRDHGSRTTWIRRRGLEATARRAIDRAVTSKLILHEVNHVDVSIFDHGDSLVMVRLDVDVLAARHAQGTLSGLTALTGGGLAVGTTAAAFAHPAFLLAASAGAGVAALGHWGGGKLYRTKVSEIEDGLNGFLDRLERGERRMGSHGRR